MGFNNVNDDELNLVAILDVQCLRGSDPPPKGWSGEGAEYHHYRLFRKKLGKPSFATVGIS